MNLIIIFTAKYFFLISTIVFLAYLIHLWLRQRKKLASLIILSVVSFPLSLIIARVLSHFIYDPRPFVVDHVKSLIAHVADNGFPSDHMLLSMTIASVIFVYSRKIGFALTLVAICVGAARILARVHHVEDIVGSAAIAIAATYISVFLTPLLTKKFT